MAVESRSVVLEKTAIRRKKLLPVQAVVKATDSSTTWARQPITYHLCGGRRARAWTVRLVTCAVSFERSRRLAVGKISIAKVYVQGRYQRPVSACHKTATVPPAHHSRAHCFTCAITPLLLLSRACAVLSTLRGLIPRGLASTPLITTCMAVLSTFVACPRPCTYMPPHEDVRFGIWYDPLLAWRSSRRDGSCPTRTSPACCPLPPLFPSMPPPHYLVTTSCFSFMA